MQNTKKYDIPKVKDTPLGKAANEELRNYIYASIISADNDEFGLTEDDKQEIIYRHKLGSSWDYILEPIKDEKKRKMLIEFFEEDEK